MGQSFETTECVRLLLADHRILIREGVGAVLEAHPDVEVVAQCATVLALENQARRAQPDVVCLSTQFPDTAGTPPCAKLRTAFPPLGIVLLVANPSPGVVAESLALDPHAVVDEASPSIILLAGIWAAARGRRLIDSALPEPSHASANDSVDTDDEVDAKKYLTPQELRVLQALPGRTNQQIAKELGSSGETIKSQLSSIYRKLDARDRAHAVAIGVALGLLGGIEIDPSLNRP